MQVDNKEVVQLEYFYRKIYWTAIKEREKTTLLEEIICTGKD